MSEPLQETVLEMLRKRGAALEGHFLLSSGLHSANYLQCALLMQYPSDASRLGKWLADRFKSDSVDLVIGPALGGVIVAHEVAKELGVRALFTERKRGTMTLSRGFRINRGERTLLAEDVVTTGESLSEVANLVKSAGGILAGVCAIVDRREDRRPWPLEQRFESLLRLRFPVYASAECPLCRDAIPIEIPGSRHPA